MPSFAGDWPDAQSPLSCAVSAASDGAWSLTGRRLVVGGDARQGLLDVRGASLRITVQATISINGSPVEPREARSTPVEISRTLESASGPVRERWMPALDLPMACWEIQADPGDGIMLELTLQLRAPSAKPHHPAEWTAERRADGRALMILSAATPSGLFVMTDDATVITADHATGAVVRLSLVGTQRVRVALVASDGAADLARTLGRFERKGLVGLAAQRAQHARLLRDYGTAIVTPSPELDLAFEWAKLGADAVTLLSVGLREEARAVLKRPAGRADDGQLLAARWVAWAGELTPSESPWLGLGRGGTARSDQAEPREFAMHAAAGPAAAPSRNDLQDPAATIAYVMGELWGVSPNAPHGAVTLAPAFPSGWDHMTIRRVRVGPTALDCELRRRPGRIVARISRVVGPTINATLTLPGEPLAAVAVDGVALGGGRARFDVSGDHEVVFELAD